MSESGEFQDRRALCSDTVDPDAIVLMLPDRASCATGSEITVTGGER